jgi:energy-converting hydrogenase A subunit P
MNAVVPQFEVSRCVRYRFRYNTCQRCADACPHQALALDDIGAKLDPARCRNCGLCAGACRTAAFTAANFPRVELLKRAIKEKSFRFACAPSAAEADAVVPCLGAIDAPTLAYLAWRGIDIELHGSDGCGTCVHGAKGAAQLAANLEAVEVLRGDAPDRRWTPPRLCGTETTGAGKPKFRAERRQLFRRLTARGLDQALRPVAEQAVPEKAIRPGAWFVPEARELLQIVCRQDSAEGMPIVPHEALPLMDLELRPGCTACEACSRACPTGAVQVRENEEQWSLQFEFDRCVACGVCLDVCQPAVLRPRPAFNAAAGRVPVALHRLTKQRCNRCDRFFVSPVAQQTCAVCHDDDAAFAAIFG